MFMVESFVLPKYKKVVRGKIFLANKPDFSIHPSEIINSFRGSNIGKEWSFSEFINNEFKKDTQTTLGIDFFFKNI